jgi:hypothetical protein
LKRVIIPDFSLDPSLNGIRKVYPLGLEKSAPSDSEGALGQIQRESSLISPEKFAEFHQDWSWAIFQIDQGEVSQILLLHKKVHEKNPGYPAKRLKTPSGFFAAALRANFAIAKFGIKKGQARLKFQGEHLSVRL